MIDRTVFLDPWRKTLFTAGICGRVYIEALEVYSLVSANPRNYVLSRRLNGVMKSLGFVQKRKLWVSKDGGLTRRRVLCWAKDCPQWMLPDARKPVE